MLPYKITALSPPLKRVLIPIKHKKRKKKGGKKKKKKKKKKKNVDIAIHYIISKCIMTYLKFYTHCII